MTPSVEATSNGPYRVRGIGRIVWRELSLRAPLPAMVVRKAWWRFKGFVVQAAPIMLVGSLVLGLVYETGAWQAIADAIGPATESVLGLPAIAGIARQSAPATDPTSAVAEDRRGVWRGKGGAR